MRQVAPTGIPWSTTVWVDETGDKVRDMHYDVARGAWRWGEKDRLPVIDSAGRMGYRAYGRFRTVPQLIALAWVSRRRPMTRMRALCGAPRAHLLTWCEEDTDTDSTDDDDDDDWRPLELKMGLVPCVNTGWEISARGRVRGGIEQPIVNYRVFLPVANVGLVPIDMATKLIHGRYTPTPPPPRIRRTLRLLRQGRSLRQVATNLAIEPTTAWSYVHAALRHMSTSSAERIVRRLCSARTVTIVTTIAEEDESVVGIRFGDMMRLIEKLDGRHNPSELYALRSILQRQLLARPVQDSCDF